jgi:virginiamycin B lyase
MRVFQATRVAVITALPMLMLRSSGHGAMPIPVPSLAPVEITEWTVPWEKTRPRDPYVDGRGTVWFVGQEGNYIATLNPTTGQFRKFEIEEGTFPHNLIVDKSGMVWYAGNRNARIGRLDPATGKATTYPMPDAAAKDPHTLVFDREGDIWFTVQRGNFVGHLDTKSGKIRVQRAPTENSLPYGIVIDRNDEPWFVEFGSNHVAKVDRASMRITEYELPNAGSRPRRLVTTSDGFIWYADYTRGMLGRFDPRNHAVKEWAAPSRGKSLPYAMALDDKDRIWVVETGVQPNQLVGFDPKSEKWISVTPIAKSGAGTVRHMYFHKPTRTLWFGTDANTIARARVP